MPDKNENLNVEESAFTLLGLVFVVSISYLTVQYLGLNNIQEFVNNKGIYAPLILVLYQLLGIIILPTSGNVVSVLYGVLYGWFAGFLISLAVTTLGVSINFWIARKYGQKVARRLVGEKNYTKVEQMGNGIIEKGEKNFFTLVLAFSVSATIFELMAYIMGLSKISFRKFFFASLISNTGTILFYTLLGSELGKNNTFVIIGLGVLLLLILIFLSIKNIFHDR